MECGFIKGIDLIILADKRAQNIESLMSKWLSRWGRKPASFGSIKAKRLRRRSASLDPSYRRCPMATMRSCRGMPAYVPGRTTIFEPMPHLGPAILWGVLGHELASALSPL